MAVQTTYPTTVAVGYPGMVADMRHRTVISREVMATSANVGFGVPVLRGTADHTCAAVGTGSAGGFLGMSVMDPTLRPSAGDAFAPGDTAAVMLRGIMWVTASVAVTPGQAAYYTSGGVITNVSSSTTAIPNATFESTTSGAGLALLRLA